MFSLSSAAGVPARKQAINVILPEVLVLPRPLFLLRYKDGAGLLLFINFFGQTRHLLIAQKAEVTAREHLLFIFNRLIFFTWLLLSMFSLA